MTADELVNRLEASGTGSGKLDAAREYLAAHPDAPVHRLLDAMAAANHWPAGTLAKSRAWLAEEAGIRLLPAKRGPMREAAPEPVRPEPPGLRPAREASVGLGPAS